MEIPTQTGTAINPQVLVDQYWERREAAHAPAVSTEDNARAREERGRWRPYFEGRRPKIGDVVRIIRSGRRGEVKSFDTEGDPCVAYDGWPDRHLASYATHLEWWDAVADTQPPAPKAFAERGILSGILSQLSADTMALLGRTAVLQRHEPEVLLDSGHMRLERLADGALRFRDNRSENPEQWTFCVHLTPARLRWAALGAFCANMHPINAAAMWTATDADLFREPT